MSIRKKSFLLKKIAQLFTHLFFLIQKEHSESIIYNVDVIIQNVKKNRHIFNRKKYEAFNRGTWTWRPQ